MKLALSFLIALAALAIEALAQTTSTVTSQTSTTFGMVGLAPGQTARLSVLNSVRTAPPVLIPQLACRVNLSFYNSDGKLLKESTIDNLGFGKAAFLDVRRPDIDAMAGRAQIGGVVRQGLLANPVRAVPVISFCSIVATLEVFDEATNKTTVVLSAPAVTSSTPRVLMMSAEEAAPDRQPEP